MILRSALDGGSTKTKLMYGAYLSYAQIKEYLAYLEERELLLFDGTSQLYKVSEKGLQVLRLYDQMSKLVSVKAPEEKRRMERDLLY
jgi:predicted transcriptional regulator